MKRRPDIQSTPSLDHLDRHPSDEAHSAFDALDLLDQLGLLHWAPRVMRFMRHYDGISGFFMCPSEQSPMALLRCVLGAHVALQPFHRLDQVRLKERIVERLARAKFTEYGLTFHLRSDPNSATRPPTAPKPPGRLFWEPLKQPLLEFLASEPADAVYELDVNDCSRRGASEKAITDFLLCTDD